MPDGIGLRPSSDRKVRLYPTQKNSFGTTPGLPKDGGTCPQATTGEGGCAYIKPKRKNPTCYVVGLMKAYKGVKGVLDHNRDVVKGCDTIEELTEVFDSEFKRFRYTERARGNTTMLNYRIHWSGDIPDKPYARALADAIMANPEINFWNYTRSTFAIPILAGIPNLRQYLSVDPDNREEMLEVYEKWRHHGNIHLAWMGKTNPYKDGDFPHRLVACPVDEKKMELEGGCHKCKLCLKGKDVFFRT